MRFETKRRGVAEPWGTGVLPTVDYGAVETAAATLTVALGHRVLGRLLGDFRSVGAGPGLDPRDLRDYQIGDDVRHIDWNATARAGHAQLRTFEAEREVHASFLVDVSASLHLGSGVTDKRSVAIGATATLGLALSDGLNRIGVAAFDGQQTHELPFGAGRNHVQDLIGSLGRVAPSGAWKERKGFDTALHQFAERRHQPQLVVVVSDFLDTRMADAFAALATDHAVFAVQVVDDLDLQLPNVGRIAFVDPETGRTHRAHTGSKAVRQAFADVAAVHQESVDAALASVNAGHLRLNTKSNWLADLVDHVAHERLTDSLGGVA